MGTEGYRGPKRPTKPIDTKNMIFGIHPVMEALKSGKDFEKVFIQKNASGESFKELLKEMHEANVAVQKVPVERINKFTKKNHQGVVAFISPIKYYNISDLVTRVFESGEVPLLIALDGVTDVRNFGAIARSAECLGAHGIIIPHKGSAQVSADALKTSAGALNIIPVCRTDSLTNSLKYLKDSGLKIIGCTEKSDQNIDDIDLKDPVVLLLGSEEDGISPMNLKFCDEKIKIPLTGSISSLNVSVAAAINLYEVARQRNS